MVIPEGWKEEKLQDVVSMKSGDSITAAHISIQGRYPCYGGNGLRGYTSWYTHDGKYVLIGRQGALCGNVNFVQGKFFASEHAVVVTPLKGTNIKFMYYLLEDMKLNQYATSSAQPGLAVNNILELVCVAPIDKIEQTAIATALSNMDNLIASLEKLLAKKQGIKQGAMQDLLTGRKRLKGFSGKWKAVNLANISKIKARIGWQGLTVSEYQTEGYAYLITGTDFFCGHIDWLNCWYVDKGRYVQDMNIAIKNGDILISKDGTIGKVAYVDGLTGLATLNSGVFLVRPLKSSYDPMFVFYVLSSFIFREFLDELSAGSTINHLYQKDFVKFVFDMPEIQEQRAIATLLSDMDAEITALQQKLAKYRQIKQGMMAELLTGRIRLKEA